MLNKEATDLQEKFQEIVQGIINARQQCFEFLENNPNHTFRPEVAIELQQKIKDLNKEGQAILDLLDTLEIIE